MVQGSRPGHRGEDHIALEAAKVVIATGHKDPGDCYLISTARTRRIPIATRDDVIREIATDNPGYLEVIVC
jgi:PIN domain nuclease of toxin-antitoxin system